jgi:S-adenosylmethionine:tRNA ribosyltransferase-isomerase
MKLQDFDYALPPELVAQAPAAERSASRLLHLDGASGALADLTFRDLPGLIGPNDVVVMNDTRVIKARLYARKATGGWLARTCASATRSESTRSIRSSMRPPVALRA